MKRNNRSNYLLRLILDCGVLTAAFLLTRKYISVERGDQFLSTFYVGLLISSFFIWNFIAEVYHLYDDFRFSSFASEFIALIKTILLYSAVIAFTFFYFFNHFAFPKTFSLLYAGLLCVLMTLEKFIYKKFRMKIRTNGNNLKRILIVGASEVGMNFHETVVNDKHQGYHFVGFVDDEPRPDLNGQYLGKISEMRRILQSTEIDDIVVALPFSEMQKIDEVCSIAKNEAVRMRIIPDYFKFLSAKFSVETFANFPIITVRHEPLNEMHCRMVKRAIDLTISLAAIVLIFSWLFPLIMIIQKLTSRGPFFFIQDRVGRKNRIFRCYKFRTMQSEQSAHNTYTPTDPSDNRVTKFGRFLRKFNLDELPQVFNVLFGDMSLIGPRPHMIAFHEAYKDMAESICVRHLVKPGITGWAQVNGLRGDVSDYEQNKMRTRKRIEYDIWYIENWSFWLDCQIIFQTAINMVKGDKNAY